jgi:Zn-finger nucleic acid-binding protein
MQCPTDGTVLVMSERGGIEIDYCPTCRGVWLDRGELDKIIERSLTEQAPAPPQPQSQPQAQPPQGSYERQRDERRQEYQQRYQQPYPQQYRKKRKESWLSELFD